MPILPSQFLQYRRKQSVQNFGWMMVGQGFGYLFQAAYFIFLTRLLGSFEYGVFSGAFAFTSLLAPYSSVGMGTVFLRYVSGDQKNFAPYWGNILLATLGTSGALAIILAILGRHILNPDSAKLVFLAAIANCLCAQLVTECGRIFQSAEKMRVTALLNLLTNATRVLAVGGMLLAMHRATAWNWTIASVVVSALSAIAAVVSVLITFGKPQFDLHLLKERAWEGFGFSFATSTSSVYNDVDKTMLSHYGMNHANGIYTTAYRIIDFATMPVYAMRDAFIPRLFQAGRDGLNSAAKVGNRLLKLGFALSFILFIILFFTAPLLPGIVGKGFAESILAVRWLAFIPVLRSIHQMTGSILMASGYQRFRTANQLIAAAFNLGMNLWLIPRHGWVGAAWSSLATDGLLALLNWSTVSFLKARH